ncbi:flagellar motor switch protein FliN [Thermodesulfobacterium sp.]|jgi:flagellar motor switch protein FliN/FliY|uniref:flagellar motor switch protein FliN n=1 Tax=Thermodesulfobacterium sp. TaxID=1965289 RepID=UPI0026485E56|nr:flagellar motor switch protein FliN [Thermodesulfobacterium sp.]MDN5379644.1 flagellar motor switch protein FliN [Thermodesulfobacterium sp.]
MAEEEKINGQTQEETSLSPEDLMAMWEEALKEAQAGTPETQEESVQTVSQEPSHDLFQPKEPSVKERPPTQPASFEELSPTQKGGLHPDLEFILDIPLEISVEIGRTKMLIRDLLKLNQGSIIELEKFAGEPVEVYVNGKLMAKGEVVVVNDRFGVRVTEIISAQDRIKKLGS